MGHAAPQALAAWGLAVEPDYQPTGDEVAQFEAACARRLPLLLKGPTGCGKTRFVEHMAWPAAAPAGQRGLP